ncbi:3-alpha-hydroxysteroid dehydrogenase [Mycobacterium antarcticum]|uniref:coniferyl-alcohol dehydrogenase n=1 Tax=unclassified Mycolicibacterium TaxID=2636767 RepID=UPI00239072CE|nr:MULTISPECIES: coniferyl-alcohol dehydrogenase [unclassified Mycolicibacterium]BDX31067.1 3-alpha-hydroxysteroid dehydrogenase [Mycolicibacterium sp. TUM20985]GLP74417.1 3-alpha-hydroxysteroid dehydrogenase [Mycolicibacterium sp. TUM20983]GLP80214.1 3-alpha-hydroxysteroid dehydrogenase [Mycolicibacterium sp. TUM20984]
MGQFSDLVDYHGRRTVVTGCSSGIGAALVGQLTELGAHVIGLDVRPPPMNLDDFHRVDLSDPASIDAAVARAGDRVDSLFNVAGVSSGIGDPLLVVKIDFLGTRHLTEALIPLMPPGSSIASVSSLAASHYAENVGEVAGLLRTGSFGDGVQWCHDHPDALADGGYRLAKEALILHAAANAVALGARGIRINCTGPGVTDTPILDQLRSRYGREYLDGFPKPLGRVSHPAEQAAALVFLNSPAAGFVTGQVLWVDGGNLAARVAATMEGSASWPA